MIVPIYKHNGTERLMIGWIKTVADGLRVEMRKGTTLTWAEIGALFGRGARACEVITAGSNPEGNELFEAFTIKEFSL